ncbi:MAG: FtsX-like permease family protein [Balneolaceae bacterium]
MRDKNTTPPKLAQWLLALSVAWRFKEEAESDLDELYQIRLENWGEKYARKQYWNDVLSIWARRSWFQELEFTNLNTFAMLKNYLKVTFRTLRKQKIYSFINVFGLAIGLAFCALIFLYVQDELSYDSMHQNRDSVFRVELGFFNEDGSLKNSGRNGAIPLGPRLHEEVPGIETFTRFFTRQHYVKADGEPIKERILYSDPDIFQLFTFPFIVGNPDNALLSNNSAVITEKTAIKYFGDTQAVGKTLQIRKNELFEDFEVTAVVKDMPSNSTIRFNILLNITGDAFYTARFIDRFDMNIYQTYVKLNKNVSEESLANALNLFTDKHLSDHQTSIREKNEWDETVRPIAYRLNPLPEIHLNSSSDPRYSYILSGIALGILLIACINFMTLSIGRSSRRSKEIGMRKVIGAQRHQLMGQFWGEAFIVCAISLVIGTLLAELFLPVFNSLADKNLDFKYLENYQTLVVLTGFIILTGFIAGSYPALLLSGIKPVASLKSRLKLNGSNIFTKALVSFQFALSLCLIVSTLVMNNQLQFIQSKDLGFNTEQVLIIPLNRLNGLELADQLRNTAGKNANVLDITAAGTPLGFNGSYGYGIDYNNRPISINVFTVESNYIDFMELNLVKGRGFDKNLASDTLEAVIVNEMLVSQMGLTEPIGKVIPGLVQGEDPHGGAYIIGVVEDHNFAALYQEIDPAFLTMNPAWGHGNIMIRIHPENMSETIAEIKEQWDILVADVPFAYSFLDDDLYQTYQEDEQWSNIVNYSSFFAIFIATMGLFGLVTLSVNSRQKEVGIRKVLGASISQITALFAKDFLKLVILGILIATPIVFYFMNDWLTNFAYRISVNGWHFGIATALVMIIALITISFQTIRAGAANPVDTLMNE